MFIIIIEFRGYWHNELQTEYRIQSSWNIIKATAKRSLYKSCFYMYSSVVYRVPKPEVKLKADVVLELANLNH